MALADRLGWAALIVALFGIAAVYLWPEKRVVGQLCLVAAFCLAAMWAWKEVGNSRIGSTAIVFLCAGALFGSGWYWWFSASIVPLLEVKALTTAARFDGDTLSGIAWNARFSQMEIFLKNPLSGDLLDVNLVLKPDRAIVEAVQVGDVKEVRIEPALQITASVEVIKRTTGERIQSPIKLVATTGGYRIRLPRLMHGDTLKLLMAIGDVDHLNPNIDPNSPGWTISFPTTDGRANFYVRPDITKDRSLAFKAKNVVATRLNVAGTFVYGNRETRWDKNVPVEDIIGNVIDTGAIAR